LDFTFRLNQLPFIPDQIYHRRNDIHAVFGGNWQSGISTSASSPYIFIFTGKSGHQHGYKDGWDNPNVFSYTGEGQVGDMKFTKGNLALKDHTSNNKRVFLFEQVSKGFVKFISEVEIIESDYFETHDRDGITRLGIRFFFKRAGIFIPYQPPLLDKLPVVEDIVAPVYETQQRRFVNTRVGQGAYRKRIIHRWEYKCAVTSFNNLDVLVASHIIPWAESHDIQRLDVNNGILLSPTYDALFDRHLISFENNGRIILSEAIQYEAYNKIGVTGNEKIRNLNGENHHYLEKHRQLLV
jgi:5-methylcytosine-specific restriction enzyme A